MGRFLAGVVVGAVVAIVAALTIAAIGDLRVTARKSSHPANATVPAVIGAEAGDATAEVRRVGLAPHVSRGFLSFGSRITGQRPEAGTKIPRGSTVTLYEGLP
jgi:beta-lactam-binding protein with PASTA domain